MKFGNLKAYTNVDLFSQSKYIFWLGKSIQEREFKKKIKIKLMSKKSI